MIDWLKRAEDAEAEAEKLRELLHAMLDAGMIRGEWAKKVRAAVPPPEEPKP